VVEPLVFDAAGRGGAARIARVGAHRLRRLSAGGPAGRAARGEAELGRLVPAFVDVIGLSTHELLELRSEVPGGAGQRHTVLGPLGARERRLNLPELELERLRVCRLLRIRLVEEPLLAAVGLHELHPLGRSARELEVAKRLLVDRKDRAGRAHLRRHVADRGAVRQRQPRKPPAEEPNELADDTPLTQHLGHGEHQIGGGRALRELARELEAHRLDPADAPTQHPQPVDHRGVRVGADERVGEGSAVAGLHYAGEVLEVHLVADAGVGRDDLEVVEPCRARFWTSPPLQRLGGPAPPIAEVLLDNR
jgi:hypothetical protein